MRLARILGFVFGCFVLPAASSAQFQLHHWISFENGSVRDNGFTIGPNPESSIEIVDLIKVKGMPPTFYNDEVAKQLGRHCIRLQAITSGTKAFSTPFGFGSPKPIDHSSINPHGSILYQADVFIPGGDVLPNIALLAINFPAKERNSLSSSIASIGTSSYYRWGFTLNRLPFLSYTEPGRPKPVQYLNDRDMIPLLPRERWHRLSLLVRWRTITCFIDGRGAIFSPIDYPWIEANNKSTFMAGLLLSESKHSYDCYVDNLSIQVSTQHLRIPDSPYEDGWKIPAGMAARGGARGPTTGPNRDMRWLDPTAAWQKAQETKTPFLMFFCSPGQTSSDRIEKMLAGTSDAKDFLGKHVATRVDINQRKGSEIARQYNVFKVPAFIVLSPDGNTYRKAMPDEKQEWAQIAAELQLQSPE